MVALRDSAQVTYVAPDSPILRLINCAAYSGARMSPELYVFDKGRPAK